jgi:3-methylcrotonyl-CoA carboxylase alpha subunit
VYYDPMLAKVIASAETRDAAIDRLSAALREYPILGIRTNIPFLLRILAHPRFRAGTVDTGFLDGEGAALADGGDETPPAFLQAAIDLHRQTTAGDRSSAGGAPSTSADPWRTLGAWGR